MKCAEKAEPLVGGKQDELTNDANALRNIKSTDESLACKTLTIAHIESIAVQYI